MAGAEKKHHWWISNRKVRFCSSIRIPHVSNRTGSISLFDFINNISTPIFGDFSPNMLCFLCFSSQIVDKYLKDARALAASQEQRGVQSALPLIDAALALSPRLESALELKARSLLYLGRFKEVAEMLHDYIPSLKMGCSSSSEESLSDTSSSSSSSSQHLSREREKLLSEYDHGFDRDKDSSFKCFSVSDLKRKVMAGLCKNCEKEGEWRYLVLGEACCHLGLMEDAMVLLQTGKRLWTASRRRESVSWLEDSFSLADVATIGDLSNSNPPALPPPTEAERVSQLVGHIKLLLRRRTAALAALDAGLYSEAIRHFSKILDNRRSTPQGFLAECYVHRASAFRSAGRIAESIADCNRTLALEPTCIAALTTRAALLDLIRCFPDCLRDLEHLKLLYDSILRDRKLPGPGALGLKIQELRGRVANGETGNVDYYALIGLRRGCSRSELERAHLLLCLKHRPDKASGFIDRCEFGDDRDVDTVKDQARMSALLLYRLLQKGYSHVMSTIMDEEAAERHRLKASLALQQATAAIQTTTTTTTTTTITTTTIATPIQTSPIEEKLRSQSQIVEKIDMGSSDYASKSIDLQEQNNAASPKAFQGVFCRDIAAVGHLLSQVGFNRPIPVKFEALSC
ncbi:hypothetical protein Sjap_006924 [Stephania japonica]|uniref:Uncharacterized protein n=1 Tax=Stephania japonica TaxID=461633 RepID=A0AAP0K6U9_9MAGN